MSSHDYWIYKSMGRLLKLSTVKYEIDKWALPWWKKPICWLKKKIGWYKKYDRQNYKLL